VFHLTALHFIPAQYLLIQKFLRHVNFLLQATNIAWKARPRDSTHDLRGIKAERVRGKQENPANTNISLRWYYSFGTYKV